MISAGRAATVLTHFLHALLFALAFAIPACTAAVAYPFHAFSPHPSTIYSFKAVCLFVAAAGLWGGAVYSVTTASRQVHASIVRTMLAAMVTLAGSLLILVVTAVLGAPGTFMLRILAVVAGVTGCAFASGIFMVRRSDLTGGVPQ